MHRLKLERVYSLRDIKKYSTEYGAIPGRVAKLKAEIEEYQAGLDEMLPKQKAYQEEHVKPLQDKVSAIKARINQLEAPEKIREYEEKIVEKEKVLASLNSRLVKLKNNLESMNEEIEQVKDAIDKSSYLRKKKILEKEVSEAEAKFKHNYSMYINHNARAQQDKSQATSAIFYRSESTKYKNMAEKLKSDLAKLNQKHKKLRSVDVPDSFPKNMAGLKELLSSKERDSAPVQEEFNVVSTSIKSHNSEIDRIKESIDKLRDLESNSTSVNVTYQNINDAQELKGILRDEQSKLDKVKSNNASVDEKIERFQKGIEDNNKEVKELEAKKEKFQASKFLHGYIFHPEEYLQELAQKVNDFTNIYDANHPANQSKMTRACLLDMQRQMSAILEQQPERNDDLGEFHQKQILQLSGMLWYMYDATLYADPVFRDDVINILGGSVYQPEEARKQYHAYIASHQEVRAVTYDEVAVFEQRQYDAALQQLNRVVTAQSQQNSPGLKSLYDLAEKVRNTVTSQFARSKGDFDFKYHTLLLRTVSVYLQNPGDESLMFRLAKLYDNNKNHKWFGGVRNAVGKFNEVAQRLQSVHQPRRQAGMFARPMPGTELGNAPQGNRVTQRKRY